MTAMAEQTSHPAWLSHDGAKTTSNLARGPLRKLPAERGMGNVNQRSGTLADAPAVQIGSSSGKTTLAARFAGVVPATAIVHTDDIA